MVCDTLSAGKPKIILGYFNEKIGKKVTNNLIKRLYE